jgi:hypothetical protein
MGRGNSQVTCIEESRSCYFDQATASTRPGATRKGSKDPPTCANFEDATRAVAQLRQKSRRRWRGGISISYVIDRFVTPTRSFKSWFIPLWINSVRDIYCE